jgi:hypothetical protein
MIKEMLIVILHWVDPTVHVAPVAPVTLVCPPVESQANIERNDRAHQRNMQDLGKAKPGVVVDPWGAMTTQQRDAIERSTQRGTP